MMRQKLGILLSVALVIMVGLPMWILISDESANWFDIGISVTITGASFAVGKFLWNIFWADDAPDELL